jgi:glycosyltransferase involved in cell wall biosynthesis
VPVVAVIVPAYRAATHIRKVLAGIPSFVTYIVVVDDCSPDDTAELVEAWPDPRVHLVSHSVNQGVGGAVLTGYDAALRLGAEILVKMDSDDQMDPAYLLPLITPIVCGEADFTKGNRFLHVRQLQTMPLLRRVGNIGLSFLTKLASGYWNVFDPTNGYIAIHASVAAQIDRAALDRRYFFESSMLLELGLLRAVVRDVYAPARYGDEVSHLSELRALVEFPVRLLYGFIRRLWVQYFVRDFGVFGILLLMGVPLFTFGSFHGVWNWIRSARLGAVTPAGTVMLAVLPVILGIQFLLQAAILDVQGLPTSPLCREAKLRAKVFAQIACCGEDDGSAFSRQNTPP